MKNFDHVNPEHNKSDSNDEFPSAGQHCPVNEQANIALKSCKVTQQAIGNLRQTLLECCTCQLFHVCDLQENLNLRIDMVIADIHEEWGW
jgi:hypothetical protein